MEITVTPDTYAPSLDEAGNYVDHIPTMKHGLFCPCGSRKEKAYDTASKFSTHIKTKTHQKWLVHLNQNKANHYVEMLKSKEVVENQQKIIIQLETQLHRKTLTIDYLTDQLTRKPPVQTPTMDLLDMADISF